MLKIELTRFEKEELIFKLVFFLIIATIPTVVWLLVNYAPLWWPQALAAGLLTTVVFKVFIYDPIVILYRAYKRSNDV